ncbi:hypothetical protein QJS04_geneDACA015794 [Acorus gramineus]|uniref:Diacylglycerol O-acyltransferase 3, cytosolic n=1 Tax=Acorus gramineus TaxID=55184 RepID=A0AAV9BQ50_ACOGR|nr:hypothetical protein QJS04_geneDACA015794 [Acorus gramineus]
MLFRLGCREAMEGLRSDQPIRRWIRRRWAHERLLIAGGGGGGGRGVSEEKGEVDEGIIEGSQGIASDGWSRRPYRRGENVLDSMHNTSISLEAAEVLLSQIEKLRAEEKEMKRKKKEEKSAMKAARKKTCTKDESSSSSSSSESSSLSGSDCDRVVDMSRLRTVNTVSGMAVPIELPMCTREVKPLEGRECGASVGVLKEKIEVCMGSKCKRSGAGELLGEFQRKAAIDGAVVGCKCMGKCRDGPNVRVRNNHGEGEVFSDRVPVMKPLCIGVSLEDVGMIVANVFGDVKDLGLVAT